jgi:hypothetical protein
MSEIDEVSAAALLSLVRDNIPPDVQELLVHGSLTHGVKPGALHRAITAAANKRADEALQPCTEIEIEDANDEDLAMDITTVWNEISHGVIEETDGNLSRASAAKIINAFLAHRREKYSTPPESKP